MLRHILRDACTGGREILVAQEGRVPSWVIHLGRPRIADVRSTPINGHSQIGPAGPFGSQGRTFAQHATCAASLVGVGLPPCAYP